ncbi:MAG: 4-hydroxybenzoyl-CoA reductase subunit gamma [Pseudonocardia sp. SCN 72-86]|nr:MAG: 4-hydroxybenzoyl-CoA reductase subunit gamma [Pseudonocardia sp. SCN 72-86]
MPDKVRVQLTVNDTPHDLLVEPRTLLADLLRGELELTGTHVGCEQGVCGACTVLVDGTATRSCLVFAAQLDGAAVRTVESLAGADGTLHPLQQAFHENHGLQCGFCTPGMLMGACELLERTAAPEPDDVREALGGNLCRCTGYQNIVKSVCAAGVAMTAEKNGAQA